MKTLGVISCTKSKQDYTCAAGEMYQKSTLFRYLWKYCSLKYDNILIVSAKYGLLIPSQLVSPYEKTLLKMNKVEIVEWSDYIVSQLGNTKFEELYEYEWNFHLGQKYLKHFPFSALDYYNVSYKPHSFPGGIGTTVGYFKKEVETMEVFK